MQVQFSVNEMSVLIFTFSQCRVRNQELSTFVNISDKIEFGDTILGKPFTAKNIDMKENEIALIGLKVEEVLNGDGFQGSLAIWVPSLRKTLESAKNVFKVEEEKKDEPKT